MTAHKTGVLARMAARFSSEIIDLPNDTQKRFATFCEKIGIAFQIQDDILNLTEEEYGTKKGYNGEDIFEVIFFKILFDKDCNFNKFMTLKFIF